MRTMMAFEIGCNVIIGGNMSAIVTGIMIRDRGHLMYECSWWDQRTHNCTWLEQIEVSSVADSKSMKIGFLHRDSFNGTETPRQTL